MNPEEYFRVYAEQLPNIKARENVKLKTNKTNKTNSSNLDLVCVTLSIALLSLRHIFPARRATHWAHWKTIQYISSYICKFSYLPYQHIGATRSLKAAGHLSRAEKSVQELSFQYSGFKEVLR
jgi:hypothetical protein